MWFIGEIGRRQAQALIAAGAVEGRRNAQFHAFRPERVVTNSLSGPSPSYHTAKRAVSGRWSRPPAPLRAIAQGKAPVFCPVDPASCNQFLVTPVADS